jgi:hypothetical protein
MPHLLRYSTSVYCSWGTNVRGFCGPSLLTNLHPNEHVLIPSLVFINSISKALFICYQQFTSPWTLFKIWKVFKCLFIKGYRFFFLFFVFQLPTSMDLQISMYMYKLYNEKKNTTQKFNKFVWNLVIIFSLVSFFWRYPESVVVLQNWSKFTIDYRIEFATYNQFYWS